MLAVSTGHIASVTTTNKIGDVIEIVTMSEVLKIKMDNAVPKNSILPKISLRFIEYGLQLTPKSERQTAH